MKLTKGFRWVECLSMKIAIIVSQTPDTTTRIKIADSGVSIDEAGISWILNPYAEFAIEKALRLKEAGAPIDEIILIAMGVERSAEALRQGLAMGADRAVLIKSSVLNTQVLAEKIKSLGADLILGGKKSIDNEAAWAEAGVAAHLNTPYIHVVNKLVWENGSLVASRENAGEKQSYEVTLPAVITCDKGDDEPRYASVVNIMKAKKKPLDIEESSAADSTGINIVSASLPAARSDVKLFQGEPKEVAQMLLKALREDAKVL